MATHNTLEYVYRITGKKLIGLLFNLVRSEYRFPLACHLHTPLKFIMTFEQIEIFNIHWITLDENYSL